MPKNSFSVDSTLKNINTIFQIWVNKNDKRFEKFIDLRIKDKPAIKHDDFLLFIHNNTKQTLKYFDKSKYKWDFAIVRQGFYNYKEKIINPNDLVSNRQYLFVKYIDKCAKEIFNNIDFERMANLNTVIKGFSNSNVVAEYIKVKNKFFNYK